jgi:uncharacterized protein YebE (UPF0316 family)
MEFHWFDFVVLPILIMLARVVDVSLDTLRVIMVAKGYRNLAPVMGFFSGLYLADYHHQDHGQPG